MTKGIDSDIRTYLKSKFARVLLCTSLAQMLLIVVNLVKADGISALITASSDALVHRTVGLGVVLVAVLISGYIVSMMLAVQKSRMLAKDKHDCELYVMNKILRCRVSTLYAADSGGVLENLTDDLATGVDYYADVLPLMFCSGFQVLVYCIYLGRIYPLVMLILLVLALLQVVPPFIVSRYMEQYYGETREVEAQITEQMIQGYQGLAEIKHNNAISWIVERFRQLHHKVYHVDIRNQRLLQGEESMNNMLNCLLTYGTFAIMGVLVLREIVALEVALQALVISASFYAAVKDIFDYWPKISVAGIAFKRLNTWWEEERQEQTSADIENLNATEAESEVHCLEFKDFGIGYSYEAGAVFDGVNQSIPADEKVILMGVNGSGKSTLLKSLAGLLKAEKGYVIINGQDPEQWTEGERRNKIFYLSQEDPKFTISPVVLFTEYGEEYIRGLENAKRFGLAEELLRTPIAELSGGERKKVFLSLAFATSQEVILLLDEPTNSLDQAGIHVLLEMLTERDGGVVVVSHDSIITELPYRRLIVQEGGAIYEEILS